MNYRVVMISAAMAAILTGFIFMGYAPMTLPFYGVPELPWDSGRDMPFWRTMSFVRLFGALLLGFGLLTWRMRNLIEPAQQRTVALAHFYAYSTTCLIALTQQIALWDTTAGWITVEALILTAIAFGYLGYVELSEAAPRRRLAPEMDTESLRERWKQQISAAAVQQERNRLARDLHDSIKQQIFSVSVSAAAAQARWEGDPAGARAALDQVRGSAREAMVEMEAMLQHLRPAPLETVGLVEALRKQCEALQYRTGAQVTADFADLPENERLPPGTQEAIFRISQEALANIARHARARNVRLSLHADGENKSMWLKIQDDGQGFDSTTVPQGMGTANIRARVDEIDGQLDLQSSPGGGTRLAVRIPLLAAATQEARRQFWLGILNAFITALILGVALKVSWQDHLEHSLIALPLALPFLMLAISRFVQVHRRIHRPGAQELSWTHMFSGVFQNWGN